MAKSSQNAPEFVPYPAPDFALPGSNGQTTSLSDLNGMWAVLFFYPKDDTKGCTQEAVDFSSLAKDFEAEGAILRGVSKDSLKSHSKFITKYDLKVTLLADEEVKAIEAFGSWQEKMLYGRKYMGTDRSTFLIDPHGQVRRVWRNVKVGGHASDVLAALKAIRA